MGIRFKRNYVNVPALMDELSREMDRRSYGPLMQREVMRLARETCDRLTGRATERARYNDNVTTVQLIIPVMRPLVGWQREIMEAERREREQILKTGMF